METQSGSNQLLSLILKPIVRFLVRRGVAFQEFDTKAREFFVECAVAELRKTTSKINASRVSVVTGLQRREVIKYMMAETPLPASAGVSLTARVLANWEQKQEFLNRDGTPKVLRYDGDDSEFANLCASVSKAIHPGTLLFELRRVGLAAISRSGVKLLRTEAGSLHDSSKVDALLGRDIELLISAVEENIQRRNPIANHHVSTTYDNIYVDTIEEVRAWLLKEGSLFHKRVRTYLSRFDKDVTVSKKGQRPAGARVAIVSASITMSPEVNSLGPPASAKFS